MKGKFKHSENGKFESRYSDEFKRKVINRSAQLRTPQRRAFCATMMIINGPAHCVQSYLGREHERQQWTYRLSKRRY